MLHELTKEKMNDLGGSFCIVFSVAYYDAQKFSELKLDTGKCLLDVLLDYEIMSTN